MANRYTYDDFQKAMQSSGLGGQFSDADLKLAQQNPDAGMSILKYKQDYKNATTDEARALANLGAEGIRSSYGGYTGGQRGANFYLDPLSPKDFQSSAAPTYKNNYADTISGLLDKQLGYGSYSYGEAQPEYNNRYDATIQDLLDQIVNRKDFSYNPENDQLYSQYRKQYTREGQRATQDTLGAAAAASGGIPSSYAVNAAAQAGDYYASQMTDKIPELYQLAYNKYMNDYNMKLSDLGAVQGAEQSDYDKFLNEMQQYNTNRAFDYQTWMDEYGLMATDKERELMDALADSDADMGAVTQVLLDVKNAGSLKGAEASNAKRTALAESPLTDDEKREMYRYLFGEKQEDGSYTTSRDDDIMAFEQAGLDFDTFLKVQNEYTTVNEKYSGASEKAVEFSRWVNSQNLAAEQAETVRDCFKYYSQIPAEAARYDSFVSAGLSDDAAYELANSLNALEPEDGKDSVSGLQRYRAVVDAGLSTEEQMSVLGEMMQESEYSKLQTGYSYGVTPEAYVSFRELLPKFDFDGNGTFKQEEVEAAIDSMGGGGNGIVLPGAGGGQSLTVTQQAALWQLANKSWKPAKNPYSTSVGQKVYDALNAETESGIVLPDGTSYTGGLVLPKG